MLILDPNKRYTVEQIKRHPWMLEEAPRLLPGTIAEMPAEPNDQVLRFMSSLDINTTRTRQVRFILSNTNVHLLSTLSTWIYLFEALRAIRTIRSDGQNFQRSLCYPRFNFFCNGSVLLRPNHIYRCTPFNSSLSARHYYTACRPCAYNEFLTTFRLLYSRV